MCDIGLSPLDNSIRSIRVIVGSVLADLDDGFDAMSASLGQSSVPPESLRNATTLMSMYSVHSGGRLSNG